MYVRANSKCIITNKIKISEITGNDANLTLFIAATNENLI